MRQLKEPSPRSCSHCALQHFAPNSDHLACWLVRLVIPQHCSTRAELVITHTMASCLTVIRSRLSAWICQPFCCQRTFRSESIGMPPPWRRLVWWDLLTAMRSCLPAQLFWFPFQLRVCKYKPRKIPQKIKNPASSAGHNRYFLAIPREAQQVLARVARKVPHSRILRLSYRSDRDSPEWPKDFGKSPNRRSVYRKSRIRQYLVKTFFHYFSSALWIRHRAAKLKVRPWWASRACSLNP